MQWSSVITMTPELLICGFAIIMLMYGALFSGHSVRGITFLSAIILTLVTYFYGNQPQATLYAFDNMLRTDGFIGFSKILICIGALLALIFASHWMQTQMRQVFEYPVLLLLCVFGLLLMVSANDFLTLYMSLELASLSLYIMAAFDRDNSQASEAGLKYFVLGSLASGLMLFGISLIYGFSGTTNFTDLAQFTSQSEYQMTAGFAVGLVLVIIGMCFKVSAVPFHMWTPDVYAGVPAPIVAFFAVAPKVAAFILLARLLMEPFAALQAYWQPIIMAVSIASMLVGAFGALLQKDIKRLLAYSSISHVGYMLVALAVGNAASMQSLLLYLSLYLFMSMGAFGFVMMMVRHGKALTAIEELSGLSRTNPKAALFMVVILFSMAGIPPLAGFFAKMYVFLAAVEAGLISLVVVGLLSSVVAAYYYLRIIKVMYFDESKAAFDGQLALSTRFVLFLCGIITAFFFISPTFLLDMTSQAAQRFAM